MNKGDSTNPARGSKTGVSCGINPAKNNNILIARLLMVISAVAILALQVAGCQFITGSRVEEAAAPRLTTTPILTATPLPNPQLFPGYIINSKTFNTSDPWPWYTGHKDDSFLIMDQGLSNGKYVWSATAKQGVISYTFPSPQINILVNNYQISFDTRMVEVPPDGVYGLFFDFVSKGDYWAWIIRADGTSSLAHRVGGKWVKIPVKMVFTIHTGKTITSTLNVTPAMLNFYIDGAQIGSYKTTTPEMENFTANKKFAIGIELNNAGEKATFEFDNIVVSHPDTSGK